MIASPAADDCKPLQVDRFQRPRLPGRDLVQYASLTALIKSGETSIP
jgi:hypothetical protein